jgi:hypothetical protein
MRYIVYAERFGWTPAQVDALPASIEPWLLPLHDLMRGDEGERGRGSAPPPG